MSKAQMETLKAIVKYGKPAPCADMDGRSLRALLSRELIKIKETKNGLYATATAKGKKALG